VFLFSLFAFPETIFQRTPANAMESQTAQSPDTSLPAKRENSGENATPTNLKRDALKTVHPPNLRGKPGRTQFHLFQRNTHAFECLALALWTPLKVFAFPIVDFASFVVSWSASCFLTVNLTQAQAFSAPPYNYTPQTIGFFNFAVVVGQILGLITAGPLNDWMSMRATRRNGGIREPDHQPHSRPQCTDTRSFRPTR